MRKFLIIALLSAFSNAAFAQTLEDVVELETEGTYLMRVNDSKEMAKALALFEAKRDAAVLAAKYLSRKGLIETYEQRGDEIYSLVAMDIKPEIVEERWEPVERPLEFYIRIRARVRDSDFIRAKMLNKKLEKEESKESFQEEMEQNVSKEIDPGHDIAKAYRLLQRREWRMAIIYLDHLEKKYPNWGEIFMAKAIAYYAYHEPVRMKEALEKACHLKNKKACDDLKSLRRVHDIKLGP